MGDLVSLDQWRADHLRVGAGSAPTFFFDLGCPLSYLSAEHVERKLGHVQWVAVDTASVRDDGSRGNVEELRQRAEHQAHALRLPLVWPDSFPNAAPCALRAATYAAQVGAGARFALAASRLAFCGGFDLGDPEALAEAAAASGVPLDACLRSATDADWDRPLQATARGLRARAVGQLPVFRVGRRWFAGDSGLHAAAAAVHRPAVAGRPLAPVG